MKQLASLLFLFLFVFPVLAQESDTDSQEEPTGIDAFIIDTGVGAGLVVSSNIVNTGAVVPTHVNLLVKMKRHRVGIGFGTDYFVTPENLARMIFGQTSNVSKGYIMYDWMIFKYSPVNVGFGVKMGAFSNTKSETQVDTTASFSSVGINAEFGNRKFSVFVRPELEYKSYGKGSIHKEISAVANVGLRFKFMTKEEKARLEERRNKRRRRKK